MGHPSYEFTYNSQQIREIIVQNAPHPRDRGAGNDILVYIMGPYTAFDARRAYDKAGKLKSPFPEDPLFDPARHVRNGKGRYDLALADIREALQGEHGVRAFLATDVNIPTKKTVRKQGLTEPGMTPLNQSVAFSALSDAVIFIVTPAGLNAGVGAEIGLLIGEFNLRLANPQPLLKSRERFRIFRSPAFGSASIDEIPYDTSIKSLEFGSKEQLLDLAYQYLIGIEDLDERSTPVFNPDW